MPTSSWLISEQPAAIESLLANERDWVFRNDDYVETSLLVQNGRALWVSTFPILVDWSSAESVKDVKIDLLLQDSENDSGPKIYHSDEVVPQENRWVQGHEHMGVRHLPQSAYKCTLRGSSSAVLTQTAAYIVETQARRTRSRKADDTSRGVYGPKHQQSVALRTVRCFDWGRNALLRLDKSRCYAEIEAFTELPSHLTSQTTSDYQYSQWTRHLFKRVMSLEGTEGHPNEEDVDPLWM